MARELRKQEVADAVKAYAAKTDKEVSVNDHGDFTLIPGDVLITCAGGKLNVTAPDAELMQAVSAGIREILMEMPVEPKAGRSQENKAIVPTQARKSNGGQMVGSGAEITQEEFLSFICPNATAKEAYIAVKICKNRGMDPFPGGDVHFVKYGDSPLTTIASKAYFQKKAESHPQFDGYTAGIILLKGDGTLEEREGAFYLDDETLMGGWAKVSRKDRKEPFVQKMRLKPYNTGKNLWAKMPEIMIRKVALVNAEREAFPGELEGIYDASEMGQAVDADFEEVA